MIPYKQSFDKTENSVLLSDLQAGRIVRLKQQDFCKLTGESPATAERNRSIGRGCPFRKDGHRVWYYAQDILDYLNVPVRHVSTSEYDTHQHIVRLSKAREVLAATSRKRISNQAT